MKDLLLIPVMLAIFAFGYYTMAKVDRFIDENQRMIAAENRSGQSKVRIAAESPTLLHSVASALERCSNADPHIAFFLSSGAAGRILEKLTEERVDIVLLSDESAKQLDGQYASLLIPGEAAREPVSILGLPVENLDETARIHVVWNKALKSRDRDRVLFALEHEHCSLKCGYADYLD